MQAIKSFNDVTFLDYHYLIRVNLSVINSASMLQNETVDIIIRCHCKYLLSSCNNFVVDYVMRQAYKVTHFIVRESLYRPSPHDAPSYLDFT